MARGNKGRGGRKIDMVRPASTTIDVGVKTIG